VIYFMGSGLKKPIKIGYAKNPKTRLAELQTGNPNTLSLLCTMNGDKHLESAFHQMLAPFQVKGEWFFFGPVTRLLESVFQVPVPDTDLGMEYPGATDGCEQCDDYFLESGWPDWRALINYPVGIIREDDGGIRFRYRCRRGHQWGCSYDRRAARFGIGLVEMKAGGLLMGTA
jgi:hypothetical protein